MTEALKDGQDGRGEWRLDKRRNWLSAEGRGAEGGRQARLFLAAFRNMRARIFTMIPRFK